MSRERPDYSFMKSGFNMVASSDYDEAEMQQNIVVLVSTFMTEGVKHASYYLDHHPTRNVITPEDIKRGMMLEVFLFQNRPDLLQRTDEIKALIYNSDDADDADDADSDDDDEDVDVDVDVEFSENGCECAICKCMNNIYTRWANWTPKTPFETIIKKHIDEIAI